MCSDPCSFPCSPGLGLSTARAPLPLACPALSAPGAGVPQGPELMALANRRSGQLFCKAVLWFGRDVPN